jgi:hypothetical protein
MRRITTILPVLVLPLAVPRQAGTVHGILPHANPPRPKPFVWFACFGVPTHPLLKAILPNEPNWP